MKHIAVATALAVALLAVSAPTPARGTLCWNGRSLGKRKSARIYHGTQAKRD